MKFLLDFFPILAFFVAFKFTGNSSEGIYVATAVLIVCSVIQIMVHWLLYKRFEKMYLTTFVVVLIFGGATLLLQDEKFIKWKPTVVLWIFALVMIGSQYIGKKNLFQRMMQYSDSGITAAPQVWTRLNVSLSLFFIGVGALNLYVAYHFDRAVWVDFKVFGIIILNLIFMAGAIFYLFKNASIADNSSVDIKTGDEHKINTPIIEESKQE